MAAPTIHNDLPTLKDKMGWGNNLDHIKQRIRTSPTPHVIGIHGSWGSGKTSFMRQLQLHLGGEMPDDGSISDDGVTIAPNTKERISKEVICIWFDAWRYQNEPMPIVALLQEMRSQIPLLPSVANKFKKIGEITLQYTLNSLSDLGKVIGFESLASAEKIQLLGEKWEKENFEVSFTTDTIRKTLEKTINSILPSKNSRVVIFIDDLDRCNPKAAIRLLEGLKIYMSLPKCIYVLGMNENILVDAIGEEICAPKGTTGEELKLRASHYLEKICGDIFRLPLPSKPIDIFISWIENDLHRALLKASVNEIQCLPPNSRKLKALANQWGAFSKKQNLPVSEPERVIWSVKVLIVSYINLFHRDIWERWHFNPEFWTEFLAWCNGELTTNAAGIKIDPPEWALALKLTAKNDATGWKSAYPNPGDINIFWIDQLIRNYKDNLTAADMVILVR